MNHHFEMTIVVEFDPELDPEMAQVGRMLAESCGVGSEEQAFFQVVRRMMTIREVIDWGKVQALLPNLAIMSPLSHSLNCVHVGETKSMEDEA